MDLTTLQPKTPPRLCSLNLRCFPAELREQLREEAKLRRYRTLRDYAVALLSGEIRRTKVQEVK